MGELGDQDLLTFQEKTQEVNRKVLAKLVSPLHGHVMLH